MEIRIRTYQSEDCGEMARLFYHTVHTANAKDYTREQQVERQGIALTNYVMKKELQS